MYTQTDRPTSFTLQEINIIYKPLSRRLDPRRSHSSFEDTSSEVEAYSKGRLIITGSKWTKLMYKLT